MMYYFVTAKHQQKWIY